MADYSLIIQAISSAATVCGVVAAVAFGLRQNRRALSASTWGAALSAYQRYLELGLPYPALTSGDGHTIRVSGYSHAYDPYVRVLCFAAQQILNSCERDAKADWIRTFQSEISKHRTGVQSITDDERRLYGTDLQLIITNAVGSFGARNA